MRHPVSLTKTLLITSISLTCMMLFVSGIIRHDVSKESYLELAKSSHFQSIGKIYYRNKLIGSCVLIDERTLLTAAHLFVEFKTIPDTVSLENGRYLIVRKPIQRSVRSIDDFSFVFANKKYKSNQITLHPSYMDSLSSNKTDLAIIALNDKVFDIIPANLYSGNNELGKVVQGAGYGVFNTALNTKSPDTSGLKIAGENMIDEIGGYKVINNGIKLDALLYSDFDHPENYDCCNKMGSPVPLPLEYSITGGDSGGGLFMKESDEWKLIGITSISTYDPKLIQKFGAYGSTNQWVRISAFNEWINSKL